MEPKRDFVREESHAESPAAAESHASHAVEENPANLAAGRLYSNGPRACVIQARGKMGDSESRPNKRPRDDEFSEPEFPSVADGNHENHVFAAHGDDGLPQPAAMALMSAAAAPDRTHTRACKQSKST